MRVSDSEDDCTVTVFTGMTDSSVVFCLDEQLTKAGYSLKSMEGYPTGNWILMDYGDLVVHVFDRQNRLFYDLERIWRDGEQIDVDAFLEEKL